jgi:hypothetical protein
MSRNPFDGADDEVLRQVLTEALSEQDGLIELADRLDKMSAEIYNGLTPQNRLVHDGFRLLVMDLANKGVAELGPGPVNLAIVGALLRLASDILTVWVDAKTDIINEMADARKEGGR